jgi:hypothetical protein
MQMENGYYHIKMTWFDEAGRVANYNQSELLAPQIYGGAGVPIDIAFDQEFYVPIYKEKQIQASNIFVDLSGSYKYYWYVGVEKNPITPYVGENLTLAPQKEAKEFLVKLVATKDISDERFPRYEKTFKVIVYVPKIELEADPLAKGTVEGTLQRIPQAATDDLSDIPFSLFRKRFGIWKNLGILNFQKPKAEQSVPPLNDSAGKKYAFKNSYYTSNEDGKYHITGFNFATPTPIVMKDSAGNAIARVLPYSGRIELVNGAYSLSPLSATKTSPTRVAVVDSKSGLLAGSVYYVPDKIKPVTLLEEAISTVNMSKQGVTVGDTNIKDDFIGKTIPAKKSFGNGVAIYNQTPPQKIVALINPNGSIRFMQAGYKLQIKNIGTEGEPYIFQIINSAGKSIFEVFIHANFDNLDINHTSIFDGTGVKLGLEPESETKYASLIAQTSSPISSPIDLPSVPQLDPQLDPPSEPSPFPDLDKSHPFYNEILKLYKDRVISGYGDGTFRPDEKITRAEFIKIALGVTNCYDCTNPTDAQRAKYTALAPFPDVKLPAWYYYCISIAKDLAMITGYGDGFYRPDQNISRAEAAAVLLRQSHIPITEAPPGAYADVPDYAWYKDYVYTAVNIGLIKQHASYVFPDEQITRGEFAFMAKGVTDMYSCREVDEDGDGMPDWWEMENNLDPLDPKDAGTDYDFDGRPALVEYKGNTNPNLADEEKPGPGEGEGPTGEAACPCINNPNQNDSDGDKTIDACDNDVDGDGIINAICIFDDSGLIDENLASQSEDNCIFVPNEEQTDSDLNKVGDSCELLDDCPTLPEDFDGVEDGDGCPDIDVTDDLNDLLDPDKTDSGIHVSQGPACNFMDYEADLMDGDTIMTAITDVTTHETIYESSAEIPYKP